MPRSSIHEKELETLAKAFGEGVPFHTTRAGKALQADKGEKDHGSSHKRKASDDVFCVAKKVHFPVLDDKNEQSQASRASKQDARAIPERGRLPRRKFRPATPFPYQIAARNAGKPDVPMAIRSDGRHRCPAPAKQVANCEILNNKAGAPPIPHQQAIQSSDAKLSGSQESRNSEAVTIDAGIDEGEDRLFLPMDQDDALTPSLAPDRDIGDEMPSEPSTPENKDDSNTRCVPKIAVEVPECTSKCSTNNDPEVKFEPGGMASFDETERLPETSSDVPQSALQEILDLLTQFPAELQASTAMLLTRYEHLVFLYGEQQERLYEAEQRCRKFESQVYRELRFLHALTQSGQTVTNPEPEAQYGSRREVVGSA